MLCKLPERDRPDLFECERFVELFDPKVPRGPVLPLLPCIATIFRPERETILSLRVRRPRLSAVLLWDPVPVLDSILRYCWWWNVGL